MLYLIKIIYSFILPPGLIILLLLALSVRLWKRERLASVLLLGTTLLLYLSSTLWVGEQLTSGLERKYPQPDSPKGEIIVVLGGGATQSTPDLNGVGNLYGGAANRLLTAARLQRESGLPILFSGGQVYRDSGNEADIARRQLLALGVPDSSIMIENRSLNTEQNALYSSEILDEHGYSSAILVTSAFHMPRAVLEFRRAGVDVQPFPVDYMAGSPETVYVSKFTPSSNGLSMTSTALKEYLGILAIKLSGL